VEPHLSASLSPPGCGASALALVPGAAETQCRALIIEVAGPSAAGKTTLAHALAARLSKQGYAVLVSASARPAERAATGTMPAALQRAGKMLGLLPALVRPARIDGPGTRLIALLPSERRLWSLRYGRYLAELDRRWAAALSSDCIMIFDQAYYSALAALAALRQRIDPGVLAEALDLIPMPHLLVRLRAPETLLAGRLTERLRAQGVFERLFELEVPTTLRQVEAFQILDGLIERRGGRFVEARCSNRAHISRAVETVVAHVVAARRELRP
jgi:thymidylate kinase